MDEKKEISYEVMSDMRVVIGKALAEPDFRKAFRANPEEALKSAGFKLSKAQLELLHRGFTADGSVRLVVISEKARRPGEGITPGEEVALCDNCDCSAHQK